MSFLDLFLLFMVVILTSGLVNAFFNQIRIKRLEDFPPNEELPFVSILVPARDEERNAVALEIRKELGISEAAVVFLFVGKLEPLKQPLQLAQAFTNLVLVNPEFDSHLVLVGSGILEKELHLFTKEHHRIHLVGFQNQSQMPMWYRVGDVLCLVSSTETWGLAVNEALACGCSAIVSDRVGCAEDFQDVFSSIKSVDHRDWQQWLCAMNSTTKRSYADKEADKAKLERLFSLQLFKEAIKIHFM